MAESDIDLAAIEKLVRLVESRDLTELVVEEAGVKITVRGASYVRQQTSTLVSSAPVAGASQSPESFGLEIETYSNPDEVEAEDERIPVASPMVGVFYRSSGPDTPSYVEIGDRVEVGQVIGLIEAMKVFSEVPSEAAGTVVAIAASNGQLVRSGDPLIFLRVD